jgi:F-type H+-transporting ATPase subunit gamma
VLEALASEHSARMLAMNNATDNAGGIVEELVVQRNKARQTTITSQIMDIVGGAEALVK